MFAFVVMATLAAPTESVADLFALALAHRDNRTEAEALLRVVVREADSAWQRGERDPLTCALQGRAALLLDDRATALVAFRRALRLADSADARAGLALARERIGRPPLPTTVWMTPTQWVILGLTLNAVGWTLLTWRRWVGLLCLTLALTAGGVWLANARAEWHELHELRAVVRSATELRTGNGSAFPARLPRTLPAGTETRLLRERGEWVQVEIGPAVGWLPRERVWLDGDAQ